MEIVYSQTRVPLAPGQAFRNPRFFAAPELEAKRVLINGDWPKVAAAYARAGVSVAEWRYPKRVVPTQPPAPTPAVLSARARPPAEIAPALPPDERGRVYIPDGWRELPYSRPRGDRDLTVRGLAAMLSPEPVVSKAQAVAAIEAELARRAEAQGTQEPAPWE